MKVFPIYLVTLLSLTCAASWLSPTTDDPLVIKTAEGLLRGKRPSVPTIVRHFSSGNLKQKGEKAFDP